MSRCSASKPKPSTAFGPSSPALQAMGGNWCLPKLPPVMPPERRKVVLYLSRNHGGSTNGRRQVCEHHMYQG